MTVLFAGMPLSYLMLCMLIETSINPLMSTNCSNELVTVRVLERGQCPLHRTHEHILVPAGSCKHLCVACKLLARGYVKSQGFVT